MKNFIETYRAWTVAGPNWMVRGGAAAMAAGVALAAHTAAAAICAVPDDYATIQAAVNDGTCTSINVAAGAYAEDVTIARTLALNGAKAGIDARVRRWGGESVLTGKITISADGVIVDGFTITNPGVGYGILVKTAGSNASLRNNILKDISSTNTAQAIYLERGPDGAVISHNVFKDIQSTNSVKGVFIGDSVSDDDARAVVISENLFFKITSDEKGAYGILVNNGANGSFIGTTPDLLIENNEITWLSAPMGWTHAIGLEADTPNVVVAGNTISKLSSSGLDTVAVFFEGPNASYFTARVNQNNFLVKRHSTVFGIAVDPNVTGSDPLDGTCNYWDDRRGPAGVGPGHKGALVTDLVTFDPWRKSPAYGGHLWWWDPCNP